jgi:hypothetical protein
MDSYVHHRQTAQYVQDKIKIISPWLYFICTFMYIYPVKNSKCNVLNCMLFSGSLLFLSSVHVMKQEISIAETIYASNMTK